MANTQVAVYTKQTLELFDSEVLQVMRQSYAPTATDAEFTMFAHRCAVTGLDPFKNQIFFTKYKSERYGEQVRIMYAEDAYLDKARERDGFQPPDTQVVREKDTYRVRRNPETKEMEIVEHEFSEDNRGKIVRAYSIAYRDGYRPVTAFVEMADLDHMFTGPNKDNWNKWTSDMICKMAEQRALKKQYGLTFGEDEQAPIQNDIPEYKPGERKEITHEASHTDASQQPSTPPPVDDETTKITKARDEMKAKFKQMGITTKDAKEAYLADNVGAWKGDAPTLSELIGVLKVMDMHIAQKNAADAQADDDLLETIE
jgi:recombination protein RecT